MKQQLQIGDKIYVDSSYYLTHGQDDFQGGLCTITCIEGNGDNLSVEVKEEPGAFYKWSYLKSMQAELKKKFSALPGRHTPDYRDEFNTW